MASYKSSRIATSRGMELEPRLGEIQVRGRGRNAPGQAAVELAIIAPVLLTLLIGVAVLGVAFDQYLALTFATDTGAQALSISRGQTTDPCQTTSQAVYLAAPQLKQSNLLFSIVLNGNSVASAQANPSCTSGAQYLVQSQTAKVTVTYPCNVTIMGVNPIPNCTLTAQTALLIQ
jgi:Flp pilus assembly protein TadG